MEENNLPYSNIIQGDISARRLSGLHFTPYENYYPIPEYELNPKIISDDRRLLYHLVEKRFPNVYDNKNLIRPVHGIHVSPNRDPHAEEIGWALKADWKKFSWIKFRDSAEFRSAYVHFSDRVKTCVDIIDDAYKNWSP
jgi:hypothetical protein